MAAINRLAPQLSSFSFITSDLANMAAPELDWTNFINLRTSALVITAATARILHRIPSKLQALRLVTPLTEASMWMPVLKGILKEWAPCMERLGRLVLPTVVEGNDRCARLCRSRGVQEEYDAPDTGPSFWDDWEHSVLWWYATTSVSVATRR